MPVNTVISIEQNLVVHTITASVDRSIIVDTISKTLKNSDYQSGMNAIWHFNDISNVNLTSEDLIFVAEYASKNIDIDGKPYKLALVAEKDLPYGLTRVYEAWSSERPVTISNFRILEDALNWIEE